MPAEAPATRAAPVLAVADEPVADQGHASGDAVARFEQEMQELEEIVAQMERGDLRLEDALKLFERGTRLSRSCRHSLDTAELRVRTLLDTADADEAP